MHDFKTILITLYCIDSSLFAQSESAFDFVNDTIFISIPILENISTVEGNYVLDERKEPGQFFAVLQKNKFFIFPIDNHLLLTQPLDKIANSYLYENLNKYSDLKLIIENLTYWQNENPIFNRGYFLNGYTKLIDKNEKVVAGFQWEVKQKKSADMQSSEQLALLLQKWLKMQSDTLQYLDLNYPIPPYSYRRRLQTWFDIVYLSDGFIVNSRLSIDFPTDQMSAWIRGAPGLYYRKSLKHESIAFGGYDQQWYWRINSAYIARFNLTGRIGFNRFNDEIQQIDWWNMFMVNIGIIGSVEYCPIYFKGIYGGIGLNIILHVLPEIINRIEIGPLFTIGVCLP